MQITVNRQKAGMLIDALLARWRVKDFPYNSKRAVLPQTLIPDSIRNDPQTLALFYFFTCLYMRGGIQSATAFRQLIRMWKDKPGLFVPDEAASLEVSVIQETLRKYIGWDAENASRFWKINAGRLSNSWNSNPFELIRGVTSYEEAVRRITNKRTTSSDTKEEGFYGFQYKMASMILYFFDWEGWLSPRFLYPSPADFHHYRLFLANEVVVVSGGGGNEIRAQERVSNPMREMLLWYLKSRGADPVELADTLWLFSLLMCGESPDTVTRQFTKKREAPLFIGKVTEESASHEKWIQTKTTRLLRTCGRCVLQTSCRYAIPANPYFERGTFVLRPRKQLGVAFNAKGRILSEKSGCETHTQLTLDFFGE